jgi:orotate phosphoribosyltransferase
MQHILLLEDTWTSGGNAQSAALSLRRAGAVTVTVLALARWLKPEEPPPAAFLTSHLSDYDPAICPLDEHACIRRADR